MTLPDPYVNRGGLATRDASWKKAVIAVASSGDNTAIPSITGQCIRIMRLALTAESAVDITFKNGSTSLGKYDGVTAMALDDAQDEKALWTLGEGNAFVINLGSAVAVTGTVWYYQR